MKTSSARRATVPVSVHLEPALKSALRKLAQREGRTLSNKLRKLAQDCMQAEETASAEDFRQQRILQQPLRK
jgi:hypothetical protein